MAEEFTLAQLTSPTDPPRRRLSAAAIVGITLGAVALVGTLCLGVGWVVYQGRSNPQAAASPSPKPTPTVAQPVTQPTLKPETLEVPLGQEVVMTSTGAAGRSVTHYVLTADKQYSKSPKFNMRPDKGVFYAVRSAVEVKTGSNYVSPLDYALVAADGTVYPASTGFGFDGALEGVELQAGQKAAGLVVFDVPAAALAKARIQLRSAGYNPESDQVYWLL